jgi:hypothetical protein
MARWGGAGRGAVRCGTVRRGAARCGVMLCGFGLDLLKQKLAITCIVVRDNYTFILEIQISS